MNGGRIRLKHLAVLNPETLPEDTPAGAEIRYVDIGSVGHGRLVEKPQTLLFGEAPSRARRVVRTGDTIVSSVRTYLRAVLPIGQDLDGAIVSTGFVVVRPNDADSRFLAWSLQSTRFVEEVVARSVGVSYPAIAPSEFGNIEIYVPPLPAQRRIADFLDRETERIDALIDKKRRLIDLLEEKRTATITHAVTKGLDPTVPMKDSGIPWIGEIPEHWEVVPIRALASDDLPLVDGDWVELPHIQDAGIRLIQTGNIGVGRYVEQGYRYIGEESFRLLNCTEVRPGDILICRLAEPVGRACVAPNLGTRMVTSVDVAILRPGRSMHGDYVVYMLSSDRYLSHMDAISRGGTRKRVSRSQLGATRVAVPPATEQRVIADRLGEMTDSLSRTVVALESQIDLLAEYREALITAAVTGEIDIDTFDGDRYLEEAAS